MKIQNQINRTLSQSEAIEYVRSILSKTQGITRTELANQLCDKFGFFDPRGQRQRAGCIKALRDLERKKQIVLPIGGEPRGQKRPRRLVGGLAEAKGVPGEVSEIRELQIIRVETAEQMRIWNEIMIEGHPRGAGPLVGRQLYYLVKSEHGWLGGVGFSSSALHLEARDRWIGWDWDRRRANLHHVVNMSRFLIRPCISCKNLASRVLGMVVRGFPGDFEARYGHRPLLLESFVDTTAIIRGSATVRPIGSTLGVRKAVADRMF